MPSAHRACLCRRAAWAAGLVLPLAAMPGCQAGHSFHPAAEPKAEPVAGTPQLLEFTSPHCGACRAMDPVVRELRDQYAGSLRVYTVDVYSAAAYTLRYGITRVPTQVFLDASGRELHRQVGLAQISQIVETWRQLGYPLRPAGEAPDWAGAGTPAAPGAPVRAAYCTAEGCLSP